MADEKQLTIVKETPNYWRIVFNNPPVNCFDVWTFAELNLLLDEMEASEDLRVIVFESADPDFFMSHHGPGRTTVPPREQGGRAFFYDWANWVSRLINCNVISIAKVRGRAWAQGFEFALACDMRFCSPKAHFALIEAGGTSMPGGGGIEWLSALCGRSRAMEIVCGADDFDGELAERYGFVNRCLSDDELDAWVDSYARRISKFSPKSLEVCKKTVNARSGVPSNGDLFTSQYMLHMIDYWEEVPSEMERLGKLGFGVRGEAELDMPRYIAMYPSEE